MWWWNQKNNCFYHSLMVSYRAHCVDDIERQEGLMVTAQECCSRIMPEATFQGYDDDVSYPQTDREECFPSTQCDWSEYPTEHRLRQDPQKTFLFSQKITKRSWLSASLAGRTSSNCMSFESYLSLDRRDFFFVKLSKRLSLPRYSQWTANQQAWWFEIFIKKMRLRLNPKSCLLVISNTQKLDFRHQPLMSLRVERLTCFTRSMIGTYGSSTLQSKFWLIIWYIMASSSTIPWLSQCSRVVVKPPCSKCFNLTYSPFSPI